MINPLGFYPAANINAETGIAYGVHKAINLDSYFWDEIFEQVEGNYIAELIENNPELEDEEIDLSCTMIEGEFKTEYEGETITGRVSDLGGAHIVFITSSPQTRCVSPCSPCIPNAGDLDSGDVAPSDGVECYALPVDLLDDH